MMKSIFFTSHLTPLKTPQFKSTKTQTSKLLFKLSKPSHSLPSFCTAKHFPSSISQPSPSNASNDTTTLIENVELKLSSNAAAMPPFLGRPQMSSLADQASFLLTFIAFTASVAFIGFVTAAVPTLHAMGRAAISLSKLADTAREELLSTMTAIRLSTIEISDLTLELSDLGQEIADGVTQSAQAVQAAEVGIRQVGSLAREKTISMIEERANLPEIPLQLLVAGAARKTSEAVGRATKTLIDKISGDQSSSENQDGNGPANLSKEKDNGTNDIQSIET